MLDTVHDWTAKVTMLCYTISARLISRYGGVWSEQGEFPTSTSMHTYVMLDSMLNLCALQDQKLPALGLPTKTYQQLVSSRRLRCWRNHNVMSGFSAMM